MTAHVSTLLKQRASADVIPFSLCNKKRLAIRHTNRLLFLTTLSIPSCDIGKEVRLRTYQHPPRVRCAFVGLDNKPYLCLLSAGQYNSSHHKQVYVFYALGCWWELATVVSWTAINELCELIVYVAHEQYQTSNCECLWNVYRPQAPNTKCKHQHCINTNQRS